ncbi:MAG: hypothetical protein WC750_03165 [Patescibacteria group bacterium]|jgi:guanylate kinase
MTAPLIIVTGPSGSGKTTVVDQLLKRKKIPLKRLITCTTRPRRPGEPKNRDRHFITVPQFKNEIKKKRFYEWARVYGHYYGSHKTDIKRTLAGRKPTIVDLDYQGMRTLKREIPGSLAIFIVTPLNSLKRRLLARKPDPRDYKRRIAQYKKFMAAKKYADAVIINADGQLAKTVRETERAIRLFLSQSRKT